mgnify:CR=1 FL=1
MIKYSLIRLTAKIPATAWKKNNINAEIGQRVKHVNTLYIIMLQTIVPDVRNEIRKHSFIVFMNM